MEDDIKKILDNHERRILALENKLKKEKTPEKNKNYKGLAGGIRLLISNGFFNQPKTLSEILSELKREGYTSCTKSGVSSTLLLTFIGSSKPLERKKEEKTWRYLKRSL